MDSFFYYSFWFRYMVATVVYELVWDDSDLKVFGRGGGGDHGHRLGGVG